MRNLNFVLFGRRLNVIASEDMDLAKTNRRIFYTVCFSDANSCLCWELSTILNFKIENIIFSSSPVCFLRIRYVYIPICKFCFTFQIWKISRTTFHYSRHQNASIKSSRRTHTLLASARRVTHPVTNRCISHFRYSYRIYTFDCCRLRATGYILSPISLSTVKFKARATVDEKKELKTAVIEWLRLNKSARRAVRYFPGMAS